jgi:hypothetical protein
VETHNSVRKQEQKELDIAVQTFHDALSTRTTERWLRLVYHYLGDKQETGENIAEVMERWKFPLPDLTGFKGGYFGTKAVEAYERDVVIPFLDASEKQIGESLLKLVKEGDSNQGTRDTNQELANAHKIMIQQRDENRKLRANIVTLKKYKGCPDEATLRDLASASRTKTTDRVNVSAVSKKLGVDRKTARKWLRRYRII